MGGRKAMMDGGKHRKEGRKEGTKKKERREEGRMAKR